MYASSSRQLFLGWRSKRPGPEVGWRLATAAACLALWCSFPMLRADDADGGHDEPLAKLSEMKPTEVGIRFTPRMAEVIGKKLAQQMKGRYDLDDEQEEAIREIIGVQMMNFATKNAKTGRDLIEMMTETMIENDGQFPKDAAMQFGKMVEPMIPELRGFFTETSGKIGQKMGVKQRLKFTGDMAAATAGLAIFENRMKRWQEGKVGNNANPFWDPSEGETTSAPAETEPEDPNETSEHRQARQNVERWVQWQVDIDKQWGGYVDRAIEYYGMNERQQATARSILDDCAKRAERIKTPEWRATLIENRIARQLLWGLGDEISQGPYMYKIEKDYEKLRKPLLDLESELKRRVDELPTSEQRAAAKNTVKKALSKKGMKKVPT